MKISSNNSNYKRAVYLDCFAGISGDMFLGALIDAGVEPAVLESAINAMNLGATLSIERVDRSGITSTKVNVLESGRLAEQSSDQPHQHLSFPEQHSHEDEQLQQQPLTQHRHKTGHAQEQTHTHEQAAHDHGDGHQHSHEKAVHEHAHGRSLTVIRQLIQASSLNSAVKRTAVHAFELLGASEAKIHNVPVDQIHFHEVGAIDAICDIVAASAGIHALDADQWFCSPINVGSGMVDCAHGRFPVPAPATADLLKGFPTYATNLQMELVTPTGAALLRTLFEEKAMTFGQQPAMRVQQIGYGAGTRNPKNFPNVLRLSLGELGELSKSSAAPAASGQFQYQRETVTVLETALDDLSPQIIAQVAEEALERGALDVMLTPVVMKKGRPGTLMTILSKPEESSVFEELLLRETTTLGVRIRQDQRSVLTREYTTVNTSYGDIRIKTGILNQGKFNAETLNANPEFEDCRSAADQHHVPVKQVQQAAMAAYLNGRPHA